MQPLDSPTVPVFKLYGEQQIWPTPDLLHCELIPRRSSLYQWEIQPHRHADLFQLFYIQRGNSQVEIEGKRHDIERASLQVVPPLCVHGFQFPEDIEGYVLTLAAPLVARFEAELGPHLSGADCYPVGEDSRLYIDTLFAALLEEYEGSKPFRDTLLQSMVSTLLIWICRRRQRLGATSGTERSREYLVGFIKLVERHYREHLSVEDYAHRVGVSSTYLNNLCRQLIGQSALQVIHQRLLLEAKRDLIYTGMTISQLSDNLGFSDPTYFSRFFKRLSGLSPNAYRSKTSENGTAEPH
ncbi:HTH-type transcriptional regulator ChbR [Pseudomonas oleovorans subsp. oleovorans]|uniref:Transcriptional regulator PobR n=1 Tax=Ectopseudomonas oleovorans TaxID=301 RepID=A0A379JSN4_ECTOL|nr:MULTISPECIES: helix-turn-helix domain-containing protein [Pseudomonadaceae]OWK49299.1 HTH-type transcriptional regulator ChbR [Pseudomonas oleovorans subsp. oleovorans]GLZ27615.1 transcriptional regulator [Stutzerimonas stutzeri]SUD51649.1 transcriptional regulator PobR [Pseudomonas oleovorans]HBN9751840.1 helix-turn-helix domain-containing protein [Pseudomonas aeruginosa]